MAYRLWIIEAAEPERRQESAAEEANELRGAALKEAITVRRPRIRLSELLRVIERERESRAFDCSSPAVAADRTVMSTTNIAG
jgi:hypothetical protein